MMVLRDRITEPRQAGLVPEGKGWRIAKEGEAHHATGLLGPAPAGGMLRVAFVPEHTPIGPHIAPRAAAMLATLARHWTLDIPPLIAARAVR